MFILYLNCADFSIYLNLKWMQWPEYTTDLFLIICENHIKIWKYYVRSQTLWSLNTLLQDLFRYPCMQSRGPEWAGEEVMPEQGFFAHANWTMTWEFWETANHGEHMCSLAPHFLNGNAFSTCRDFQPSPDTPNTEKTHFYWQNPVL